MEALKPYLASAGKGLAFGAGVAIPTALVGKYLMNSARDAASDTLTSTVDNTLGRVIHRGRQYLGMEPMDTSKQRSKTSELDIAYSLNTKLRNAGFDGVKTAADSAYISDVITRSNAHVSDILNTLLN
jgi:hypothetical protein